VTAHIFLVTQQLNIAPAKTEQQPQPWAARAVPQMAAAWAIGVVIALIPSAEDWKGISTWLNAGAAVVAVATIVMALTVDARRGGDSGLELHPESVKLDRLVVRVSEHRRFSLILVALVAGITIGGPSGDSDQACIIVASLVTAGFLLIVFGLSESNVVVTWVAGEAVAVWLVPPYGVRGAVGFAIYWLLVCAVGSSGRILNPTRGEVQPPPGR
jgi:hypothetical protein